MVGSVTAPCFDRAVFVEFAFIILITIRFVEVRVRLHISATFCLIIGRFHPFCIRVVYSSLCSVFFLINNTIN